MSVGSSNVFSIEWRLEAREEFEAHPHPSFDPRCFEGLGQTPGVHRRVRCNAYNAFNAYNAYSNYNAYNAARQAS